MKKSIVIVSLIALTGIWADTVAADRQADSDFLKDTYYGRIAEKRKAEEQRQKEETKKGIDTWLKAEEDKKLEREKIIGGGHEAWLKAEEDKKLEREKIIGGGHEAYLKAIEAEKQRQKDEARKEFEAYLRRMGE